MLIPPLAEQRRIVGILDEAFEGLATAKANAEQNLQNARALFESHLQAVFTQRGDGWVEKCLGETCEMYQPKTIGTKDLVANGPYPVFGANGVIGRVHERSAVFHDEGRPAEFLDVRQRLKERRGFGDQILHGAKERTSRRGLQSCFTG